MLNLDIFYSFIHWPLSFPETQSRNVSELSELLTSSALIEVSIELSPLFHSIAIDCGAAFCVVCIIDAITTTGLLIVFT